MILQQKIKIKKIYQKEKNGNIKIETEVLETESKKGNEGLNFESNKKTQKTIKGQKKN